MKKRSHFLLSNNII